MLSVDTVFFNLSLGSSDWRQQISQLHYPRSWRSYRTDRNDVYDGSNEWFNHFLNLSFLSVRRKPAFLCSSWWTSEIYVLLGVRVWSIRPVQCDFSNNRIEVASWKLFGWSNDCNLHWNNGFQCFTYDCFPSIPSWHACPKHLSCLKLCHLLLLRWTWRVLTSSGQTLT